MAHCKCCNQSVEKDELINGYCGDCWGTGVVTMPLSEYERILAYVHALKMFKSYVYRIDGDIPIQICEIFLRPNAGGGEN